MKTELILCFDKDQALGLMEISGGDAQTFLDLSGQLDKYFIPRYVAEESSTLIHPIPYFAVLNKKGKILLYQRGKGVGESRLLGSHSIGFGGHVELEKDGISGESGLRNIEECITSAYVNELNEELEFSGSSCNDMLSGMIYDDTNEVGKVHLGISGSIVVESATIREEELLQCGWYSAKDLLNMHKSGEITLENWSLLLLEML